MKLKEFYVKLFANTFTVVANNLDDVTAVYPDADIVSINGTHDFYGDGSLTVQSITKATPIAAAFTGKINSVTGSSHVSIPTAEDMGAAPVNTIAFYGPAGCIAYKWDVTGFDTIYGQNVSIKFETVGTYIVKLTTASDGGQSAPQYMKILIA